MSPVTPFSARPPSPLLAPGCCVRAYLSWRLPRADADHGAANVTLELQMLVPVLKPGDYVIVEDTNLDGHEHAVAPGWGPSPYDAITQFMAMNRDVFERDLHREVKFGFSQAMAVRACVRACARASGRGRLEQCSMRRPALRSALPFSCLRSPSPSPASPPREYHLRGL